MILPVGVGAMSPGPKGKAGLTTTTGSTSAKRRAMRSERCLVRTYSSAMSWRFHATVSSEGRPSGRRPTAAIDEV